jgi:hypothetical protein
MRPDLVEEIRINPKYTQYFLSEFDKDKKEGDPKIVKRTMFTADYLRKLGSHSTLAMLPPNCRYIERTGTGGYITVIEEPPAMRTISISRDFWTEKNELVEQGKWEEYGYKGYNVDLNIHKFSLAFPYVIFILVFDRRFYLLEGMVFVRIQQLIGMSDYLLKTPLSNISSDQKICFGEHANNGAKHSLNHAVQNAIMVFWSAHFNTDYMYNCSDYKKKGSVFSNMLKWQYYSNTNPMFIYDADWIRIERTFGEYINYTKCKEYVGGTYAGMDYKDVTNSIFSQEDSGVDIKITPRGSRKARLFYDVANGITIGNYFIHQGDPFQYKNGDIVYIESFAGFQDGGRIHYIQVDKNGKKIVMKLTSKLQNYIAVSNKALRYVSEVILPNKTKVKSGDILIVEDKNGTFYSKVDFIRNARDGSIEIKIGSDYYLADKLNATLFNITDPQVDGIKLQKGKEYLIITDPRGGSVLSSGDILKYTGVSVSGSTNIKFDFLGERYRDLIGPITFSLQVNTTQKAPRIYELDAVREFDGSFRLGKSIFCMTSSHNARSSGITYPVAWELADGNGAVFNSYFRLDKPTTLNSLVKDDRFFLPGIHYDIDFRVGDKVVVANWGTPTEMLKIKEIAGFSFVKNESSKRDDLYFILTDREGKLSKHNYIEGYNSVCHIGSVRKITNRFNGVSAGTKIISDTAGIYGFPKKDVNIIIGFITDTGGDDPLVLCSNCQTLWFSDIIANFKQVSVKSAKWKTLSHSPIDLSKIKPQAGDIINGTDKYRMHEGYMMAHMPEYANVRATILSYYTGYPEAYGMDRQFSKEYIYNCIPNPRLSPSQLKEFGTIRGFSNFHGLFFASQKSGVRFINQPGRIINVSSSAE